MGAGQSKPDAHDEKVFAPQVPISVSAAPALENTHSQLPQFSPDVVNQLSDNLDAPETTPQRQSVIDSHIRARIQGELERLKKEEEDVRHQIEAALEKENLDRERSMAGDASASPDNDGSAPAPGAGDVKTSAALFGDLEEIRNKINKYHSKRDLSHYPEVQQAGSVLAECYRCVLCPPASDKFNPRIQAKRSDYSELLERSRQLQGYRLKA
jgi:altered-inheritance-of-mitochondria protein 13